MRAKNASLSLNGNFLAPGKIVLKGFDVVSLTMAFHFSGNENAGDDILTKPRAESPTWRPGQMPAFPKMPDAMVSHSHTVMEERREKLEAWLQGALSLPINRNYHETVSVSYA